MVTGLINNIKIITYITCVMVIIAGFSGCTNNGSNSGGDLIAEPVPPVDNGNNGGDSSADEPEVANIFTRELGTWVSLSSIGATVDPIGTTLPDDFDGDGILNINEGMLNAWVANYPFVESYLAAPVTMKIEVSFDSGTTYQELSSNVSVSDVEKKSEQSMNSSHREEVNLQTVQYQDSYNSSQSTYSSVEKSRSSSRGGSIKVGGFGVGGSKSKKTWSKVEKAHTDAYGETKTKWSDIPFKNNLQSNATNIKSDAAVRNARNLRKNVRTDNKDEFRIANNAGYVRASLYLTNSSVNMPVRLTDIQCSLLLEAPDGSLLPVQSFKLRNTDYSLFEIDLYGGDTFGPYVVELKNLNTYEIKDAIEKGYNPRIYIIDYKMTHVDDSNYKVMLNSNYAGDNLKIVEENAKGRTAGVRIVGPNIREFYRVVAFDSDGNETLTGTDGTSIAPGVSLEKGLDRIALSGHSIEYAYYLIDMSGMEPQMSIPRFVVRGIKSINGVETKLPKPENDENEFIIGTLKGLTERNIEVYTMKPSNEWTDDDYNNFKVWTVFAESKYYVHAGDLIEKTFDLDGAVTSSAECTFEYEGTSYPVVEGIKSTIWPGDHYDIVYLDLAQYFKQEEKFGTNPIDTGETLYFNTRWSLDDYGDNQAHYFYPDMNSQYIGDAGLGDTIEITVDLKHCGSLVPVFKTNLSDDTSVTYDSFEYAIGPGFFFPNESPDVYSIDEAIDLELSLGLDGKHENWANLVPEKNINFTTVDRIPYGDKENGDYIEVVNRSWNFLEQQFTIVIHLPDDLEGVGDDGLVKLYLRTSPHSIYRESVWPMPGDKVKQFRGRIAGYDHSQRKLVITKAGGFLKAGNTMSVTNGERRVELEVESFTKGDNGDYTVVCTKADESILVGEGVYVDFEVPVPEATAAITIDNGFFTEWNEVYDPEKTDDPLDFLSNNPHGYVPLVEDEMQNPLTDYGLHTGKIETNWIGSHNYNHPGWNLWNDATMFPAIATSGENALLSVTGDDGPLAISLTIPGLIYNDTSYSTFLEAYGSSTEISTENDSVNSSGVASAISGNIVVTVWDEDMSGDDIRCRIEDVSDKDSFSGISDVGVGSSGHNASEPQVVIIGERALVVWTRLTVSDPEDMDVVAQLIDLNTGSKIGQPTVVHPNTSGNQYLPKLGVFGSKAIVFWIHRYNVNYSLIDTLQNPAGDLEITNAFVNLSGSTSYYQFSQHEDTLFVINKQYISTETGHALRGFLIHLNSDGSSVIVKEDIVINPELVGTSYPYGDVSIVDGKAFVVWSQFTDEYNIKGRFFSCTDGEPLTDELLVNSTSGHSDSYPRIATSGNRSLVVWERNDSSANNYDICGRLFNASAMLPIGDDTRLHEIDTNDQRNVSIAVYGDRALFTWDSDHSSTRSVMGREFDFVAQQFTGTEMEQGTTNLSSASYPKAVLGDQHGCVSFLGINSNTVAAVYRRILDKKQVVSDTAQYDYTGNLFFTAPLLERNYEVKVRIVE